MGLEVADIFRRFGGDYLARHGAAILPSHRRAIADISSCRTPARGGHLWHCPDCDRDVYVYHGCRNRSCPACHTQETREWLEARQAEILPCDYFHAIATIPEALRSAFRSHQKELYGLFMQVAADVLLTLCRDPKHLGATPGILAVLHTWTGMLDYHLHVHFLVTAGGISPDGLKWIPAKPGFLVPVRALSRLLRTRLKEAIRQQNPELLDAIPASVWQQDWVFNCFPRAGGEQAALDYLARYVFRIAITNRRLLSMDDESVTFQYKHRKTNRLLTCTLSGHEFLRRYLQHVLPKGFHKVRYYGLWHPSNRHRAARVRQMLLLEQARTSSLPAPKAPPESPASPPYPPRSCPHCGSTDLVHLREIPRPRNRGP